MYLELEVIGGNIYSSPDNTIIFLKHIDFEKSLIEIYKYDKIKLRPNPDFTIETKDYVTSIINLNETDYIIAKKNIIEVWDFKRQTLIYQLTDHTTNVIFLLRIPTSYSKYFSKTTYQKFYFQ